jgi:NhaP-type Na+/H+ or K+/H+ antiporter
MPSGIVDTYIISLVIIGLASLAMAWMPAIAQRTKISYAIVYVLVGMGLYSLLPELPDANPFYNGKLSVHLTELVVIISLMGTGLKIDQPFTLKSWRIPFRLVSVTMLLSIGAMAALAYYVLKFDLASALLLGAVLAPTDPVLASDVQVAPPLEGRHDNVRFSLTAEAGMNDGTAFPFTWLAVLATTSALNSEVLTEWFFRDVVYRMLAGIALGVLFGRLLAYLIFTLPQKRDVVAIRDGFVGVAATLLVYGVTELVWGYGFIAVFVTAITLRNYELDHKYHRKLHDFTEQIERILVAIMLLLFGGLLVHGILASLNQTMVWLSLLFVLLLRPLTGLVVMLREKFNLKEKLAISFFGIRGMGSLFYLSFALEKGTFKQEKALWAIVSFIIVLSLLIHGFTAGTVIQKLEEEAEAQEAEDRQKDEGEKKRIKEPKK